MPHVDHYFAIGLAHLSQGNPCEDYALSGTNTHGLHFGVVSDGCSGANANTDVGARALSWAFQRVCANLSLQTMGQFGDASFGSALIDAFVRHHISDDFNDYLATLVGFVATPKQISVLVHGDGAVIISYRNGYMALIEMQWQDNMPLYLNYQLNASMLADFLALYPDSQSKPFTQKTTVFSPDAEEMRVISCSEVKIGAQEMLNGRLLQFQVEQEGIAGLAVVSDGIDQIGNKARLEVAHEFMNFKNHQGAFVKRRLMRAMKNFAKDGALPFDDVSMAAVWFDGD